MAGIEELLRYGKNPQQAQQTEIIEKLKEILEDFFWSLNDDSQYEQSTYGGEKEKGFYPSAVCDEICPRRLIYIYLELPLDDDSQEGIDPLTRRIFDNGHKVHSRWHVYFTLMGEKYKDFELIGNWKCAACSFIPNKNKELKQPSRSCPKCGCKRWKYAEFHLRDSKLKLTGKRDDKILINKVPYLVEIKSMNTFQFQKLYEPMLKHRKQFALYMYMDGTHHGILLYEDKNSQQIKLFYFEYDEKLIKAELGILGIASKAIDSQVLPKRLKGFPNCRDCKLCQYKKLCKSETTYLKLIKEKKI